MQKPPKIFGTLLAEVVRTGLCMYCGACIASCPVNVIARTEDEVPTLSGICVLCELCYYGCPRVELPINEIERQIYGRTRDVNEPYGVKVGVYSARATDPEILERCQDGGVATTILRQALKRNDVDRVIAVGTDASTPWKPIPIAVGAELELLKHSLSKYTATGSISCLADAAVGYPEENFAFVGVPCQMQALRRLATSPHGTKKLAERVKLAVSLFCYNTYKYKPLFAEYLAGQQGVDLSSLTKVDCKAGKFKFYEAETVVHETSVKTLEGYTHPGCSKCQDFSGELSDISIGHVGSDQGWCTVITRKPEADRFLKQVAESGALELSGVPHVAELSKLSEAKRKRPAPYIHT